MPPAAATSSLTFFAPLLLGMGLSFLLAGGGWAVARGGGALPLAAGYLAGHVALRDWPPWPPLERVDWLYFLAAAGLACGLLDEWRPWPVAWRGLRWAILWGAVLGALLRPMMTHDWDRGTSTVWLTGLGVAGVAFWLSLDVLCRRPARTSLLLILALVAAGGAVVAYQSGSALLAELTVVVLASLTAGVVVGWWCPAVSLGRGGAALVAVLLPGIWLIGYFYADMPAASAVLLAVAPSGAWLGQLGVLRRLAPWQARLFPIAAAVVPVALAVGLAWQASPSPIN